MDVTAYLQKQFSNFNGVLHALAGDLTEEEWLLRPGPGQNRLGYTVWHIPRTQDHFLHTWICCQPELVTEERWAHWRGLQPLGIGVGIPRAGADLIAETTVLADVLTYADAVHRSLMTWLAAAHRDARGRWLKGSIEMRLAWITM